MGFWGRNCLRSMNTERGDENSPSFSLLNRFRTFSTKNTKRNNSLAWIPAPLENQPSLLGVNLSLLPFAGMTGIVIN